MKLGKILENRSYEKRQIYCIETEEDLYVVKGNFIKKANFEIAKIFYDFLSEKREWRHVENKVIDFFEETSEKDRINKDTEFYFKSIYANNEKIF